MYSFFTHKPSRCEPFCYFKMATRNRTLVFIQFRTEKRKFMNIPDDGKGTDKKKLLGEKYEMEDLEHGKKLTGVPPGWMSLIDDINYDISRIKAKSK